MRRPTLSTKLIAAALPLVVAVVALLALTVRPWLTGQPFRIGPFGEALRTITSWPKASIRSTSALM